MMLSTQSLTRAVCMALTTTLVVLAGAPRGRQSADHAGESQQPVTVSRHAMQVRRTRRTWYPCILRRRYARSGILLRCSGVLRSTEVVGPKGNKVRLLDQVNVITGVSGGSFTALAYGLYGDKLFADYEQRFLKRDVQGESLPAPSARHYWPKLSSTGWGRSELAAQLYDEILFNGATFGDSTAGPAH